MRKFHAISLLLIFASVLFFFRTDAQAQIELIENGSFETGNFTGWTVVQQPNSIGDWFVYSGTNSPIQGNLVPVPPDGTFAAITDQDGSSSLVLYQNISVPETDTVECSVIVYYENGPPEFVSGPDLSFNGGPNQQARIDIMDPSAGDFDVGSGVLLNLFQTEPGDPESLGYTTIDFNLSEFAGTTVRFRAAEVNNLGGLNLAIDGLTCVAESAASIPTLAEWAMIAMAGILGLAGLIFARRRRTLTA